MARGPGAGSGIGLLPHTGWAWLVRVEPGPVAAARARVLACEVTEAQVYHRASERGGDAEAFLRERRAAVVAQATAALRPHLGEARAAVVLGKTARLPEPARILAAHPLVHAAEGELWRAVFAEACAACGLSVARAQAAELRAQFTSRQGASAVAAFLDEARRRLGAPWGREPQEAALAAWAAADPPGTAASR